ncbi:NIPSNAP family protein [Aidingimonas lacisalsi]|uniref:NIPSNAP family protein n=1 Tax=Aidingimonas lacisalsi TaxID=2604086 RepID=UPI0011D1B5DC|nr:NIPSNAP family protein [Aidingimonas lacisalsi]
MLVDLRTYTMVPGRLKAFLELYEREGLPIQQKHLGNLLGYFVTETGDLNQVVHMWGYESAADREARRTAMENDPDWIAYRKKSAEAGNVQHQTNKLLRSTSFSPL